MGLFRRRREERADTYTLEQLLADYGTPTYAGEPVTPDSSLRLSAVWSCVNLLSSTIAELPVDCYRRGERDEIPLPPVLQEPSAGTELPEFVYAVMSSLLLRGNCYGLITARGGPGLLPAQVELLNPDRVSVRVDQPSGRVIYTVQGREVDKADVWHVRAFTSPGCVVGLSPIEYAKQSVGLGIAAERFGATFFGDGATPSGIITSKYPLDEDGVKLLDARWKDAHGKKRKTAVLVGDLHWEPISIAPEESQFVETQRFSVSTIARLFNVPPELIAGEAGNSLTYANTGAQALHFVKFSLQPWMSRIERALSKLIPSRQYVKLNPDALLRSTTTERFNAYKVALDAGFMTIDEVRALEDLPPLAGSTLNPSGNGSGTPAETVAVS